MLANLRYIRQDDQLPVDKFSAIYHSPPMSRPERTPPTRVKLSSQRVPHRTPHLYFPHVDQGWRQRPWFALQIPWYLVPPVSLRLQRLPDQGGIAHRRPV